MSRKSKENEKLCPKCGKEMEEIGLYLVCNSCNYGIDTMAWGFSNDEEDDEIPKGCKACGGPYPHCKTSCKLFDE